MGYAVSLPAAAVRYAHFGFAIFPIAPGQKKPPLTRHGCLDASCEVKRVQSWWEQYPEANIGLATGEKSGLIVLDYDCKNGKHGLKTFEFINRHFCTDTLTAQTPSGGVHQFFSYPGRLFHNSVEILPGLDIRTDGGYVVIAPSIVGGKSYLWTRKVVPATMPSGLIVLLQSTLAAVTERPAPCSPTDRETVLFRARQYVSAVPPAIQGQGGDCHTFKLVCRVVRGFDLSPDEALYVLQDWNRSCKPPWSDGELAAKISRAWKYGSEVIGGRLGLIEENGHG